MFRLEGLVAFGDGRNGQEGAIREVAIGKLVDGKYTYKPSVSSLQAESGENTASMSRLTEGAAREIAKFFAQACADRIETIKHKMMACKNGR